MESQDDMLGPHKLEDITWIFSQQFGRCITCGMEGARSELENAPACTAIYIRPPFPRDRTHSVEL